MMWFLVGLLLTVTSVLADQPLVTTKYGTIRGFEDLSTKGIPFYQFNSIPYAIPPIGDLRFKEPQPALPWNDVLDGTRAIPACPQLEILIFMKDGTIDYSGTEDCLYLSISVPKGAYESKNVLPVLVYIHGGSFMTGSSNMFAGNELMNENVILVTINYRLGPLGFLSTEDGVIPGNQGLKDQTLALKWIKENIQNFGGDSNSITIFGLSAGGACVHYHVLSPKSKGLFNRASLQSGNMLSHWATSKGQREIALQLGTNLGCIISSQINEKLSEELMKCLQKVDAQKITEVLAKFMEWSLLPLNFGPYVDGDSIPDHPDVLLKEGKHADVDLIIGVVKDDGAFIVNSMFTYDKVKNQYEQNFSKIAPLSHGLNYETHGEEITEKITEYYIGEKIATKENADKLTKMYTDSAFWVSSDISALFHSENLKARGKNVYFYQLNHKGQRSLSDFFGVPFGKHWIAHADDCFYQFPMEAFGKVVRNEADSKIRDVMNALWVNFAKTGNPTPDNSLGFKWQPYTQQDPSYLSIENDCKMVKDTRKEIREFWKSLPTEQNRRLFGTPKYEKSEL